MRKQSMVMIVIVVLLVAATAFLVLRKDSTDEDNAKVTSSSDVKKSDDVESSSTTATSASATEIAIDNFAFSPETITIKKGTKLTWTNKDSVQHTVTGDDGKGPDSELLAQGETYSYTFNEAGSFAYHCTLHPHMKATVIVTE